MGKQHVLIKFYTLLCRTALLATKLALLYSLFHLCRGGARPTECLVESKKEELLLALKEAGIDAEDAKPKLAQYYPPFAPRFIRLQDLLLPVKE